MNVARQLYASRPERNPGLKDVLDHLQNLVLQKSFRLNTRRYKHQQKVDARIELAL
jgi:hypothetical protein